MIKLLDDTLRIGAAMIVPGYHEHVFARERRRMLVEAAINAVTGAAMLWLVLRYSLMPEPQTRLLAAVLGGVPFSLCGERLYSYMTARRRRNAVVFEALDRDTRNGVDVNEAATDWAEKG